MRNHLIKIFPSVSRFIDEYFHNKNVFFLLILALFFYAITRSLKMSDLENPTLVFSGFLIFISFFFPLILLATKRKVFSNLLVMLLVLSPFVFHFYDATLLHPNSSWNYVNTAYSAYVGKPVSIDMFFGTNMPFTGYAPPSEIFVGWLLSPLSLDKAGFFDLYRLLVVVSNIASLAAFYYIARKSNNKYYLINPA